ncbi:hypothetical protein NL108_017382 [Boleophthalmus pectinirostris]|nr:hypothetical protein NL108_017382 [Boleophthalmus pectinirostris]
MRLIKEREERIIRPSPSGGEERERERERRCGRASDAIQRRRRDKRSGKRKKCERVCSAFDSDERLKQTHTRRERHTHTDEEKQVRSFIRERKKQDGKEERERERGMRG